MFELVALQHSRTPRWRWRWWARLTPKLWATFHPTKGLSRFLSLFFFFPLSVACSSCFIEIPWFGDSRQKAFGSLYSELDWDGERREEGGTKICRDKWHNMPLFNQTRLQLRHPSSWLMFYCVDVEVCLILYRSMYNIYTLYTVYHLSPNYVLYFIQKYVLMFYLHYLFLITQIKMKRIDKNFFPCTKTIISKGDFNWNLLVTWTLILNKTDLGWVLWYHF